MLKRKAPTARNNNTTRYLANEPLPDTFEVSADLAAERIDRLVVRRNRGHDDGAAAGLTRRDTGEGALPGDDPDVACDGLAVRGKADVQINSCSSHVGHVR